mmetsp:Transcript_25367/g.53479  ORF Transcript_25367/g.53479 Transcript_25367/m.53479 type:complete len:156 (+) Transcript_25367:216-683(+)
MPRPGSAPASCIFLLVAASFVLGSLLFDTVAVALVRVGLPLAAAADDTRRHRRDEVTGHIPSTHQEILARRDEHHGIFSSRLDNVEMRLALHDSGKRLLTEPKYHQLHQKKRAYQGKLEELGRRFDERHSGRILQREELLNDRTRARIGRSRREL